MTEKKTLWSTVIFALLLVVVLYPDIVFNFNSHLFSVSGDGLKNYYNFIYHIKFDPGYFSFNGMNYPYGEYIFMVDNQPVFSNSLKFISNNLFDISYYSVAILNLVMMGSLVVSSFFMALIFTHYKFPWYISIIGAVAISFLASNVLLWQYGHYALSYSCFFPIAWYLIIKFQTSDNKIKYSVLIFINTLFWFFIHNYLGFIILSFTFLAYLFDFIFNTKRFHFSIKKLGYFVLQIIFPAIIVFAVYIIFDNHPGRIEMPFQFKHGASIYTVFFPNHSYLRPFYELFFDLGPQKTQSWGKIGNYVGLSTNLILIYAIIYLIYHRFFGIRRSAKKVDLKKYISVLLAAVVLLFFSMGIPFRYNLAFLMPSVLKQFVGLGRFAWPFYFTITFFSLYFVKEVFTKKQNRFILLLSVVLLFTEGLSNHFYLRKIINQNSNIFVDIPKSMEGFLESNKAISSEYQAIVPIPFYHKYISLHSHIDSDKSEKLSMQFSYSTGLPLMSAILSRPSLVESQNILQVFIPAYYKKPIQEALNKKPLLLLYTKENHAEIENNLMDKSNLFFDNDEFELFKLPVDALFKSDNYKYVKDFLINRNSFQKDEKNGFYRNSSGYIYYNSFDKTNSKIKYRGTGALALKKTDLNVIYKSKPNEFNLNKPYNISFWYYNHLYDQAFNSIWLEVKNEKGKIIYSKYIDPVKSNIKDGNWNFNEFEFSIKNKEDYIIILSKGKDVFADSIFVDELLIRPVLMDVFKLIDCKDTVQNCVLKNNELITY